MILNTINGDSNVAFFRALRAAGITPSKIPTITFSIPEHELHRWDPATWPATTPRGTTSKASTAPESAVRQPLPVEVRSPALPSDPIEAAYFGVHLWAQAVEASGSVDPREIRRAIQGQRYSAPEGEVQVDSENQHTWKIARLGRITNDGRLEVVWSTERLYAPPPILPFAPRPPGTNSSKTCTISGAANGRTQGPPRNSASPAGLAVGVLRNRARIGGTDPARSCQNRCPCRGLVRPPRATRSELRSGLVKPLVYTVPSMTTLAIPWPWREEPWDRRCLACTGPSRFRSTC